ncbi:MAG: hypothetical protein EBU90_06485 [Proteobacteria bacterium]|nr:hypothetical protein [Pseudomonadota bacterium]
MDKKTLKAIQILALKSIEDPSYEDQYRHISRWFSKTFYIPLNQVDNFSEEEVLRAWFEEKLRDLSSSEDEEQRKIYEETRNSILYEDEIEEVENEDDKWVQEMEKEIKESQKNKELQDLPISTEELNLMDIPEKGDISDLVSMSEQDEE